MKKEKDFKRPSARKLPSGSWFCRVRVNGKDIPITKPTKKEAEAEAMAVKYGIIEAKEKKEDKKKTLEEAVKGNPALSRCASSPQERATFFDAFVSQPFQKVYQRFFAISDLSYGVANGGRLRKLLGRLKSGKKEKKS